MIYYLLAIYLATLFYHFARTRHYKRALIDKDHKLNLCLRKNRDLVEQKYLNET